jgi:type I restriction enzyme R subunit
MLPPAIAALNALLATASINDAIAYYDTFKEAQAARQGADPEFQPLKVACVFSPPGDVSADVRQLQEDLLQERADNQHDPEEKKKALAAIIGDYNARFSRTIR